MLVLYFYLTSTKGQGAMHQTLSINNNNENGPKGIHKLSLRLETTCGYGKQVRVGLRRRRFSTA